MKNVLWVLLVAFGGLGFPSFAQDGRIVELFNDGWQFHKGDVKDGEKKETGTNDWRQLRRGE